MYPIILNCCKSTLVIITALKEELLNFNNSKINFILISMHPIPTYKIISGNYECLYIVSGVGKANAAFAIYYAKDLGAEKILWVGTAGGSSSDLTVNNIGIVTSSLYLDANFTPLGLPYGQMLGEPLIQYSTAAFSNFVYELIKTQNINRYIINNVTSGTGDLFVTNYDLIDKFQNINIGLVNCEDTAALQVASNFKCIDIAIVRYISDNLSTPGQEQQFEKSLILASEFFINFISNNLEKLLNYPKF